MSNTAKIEIRSKPIEAVPSENHLFIVYSVAGEAGKTTEYFLRGGPSGEASHGSPASFDNPQMQVTGGISGTVLSDPTQKSGSPFGDVVTTEGPYDRHSVDWTTGYQSKTILSGTQAEVEPYFLKLSEQMDKIDQAHHRYNPVNSNSNTVVFEALKGAGLKPELPTYNDCSPVWAPGFTSFDPSLRESLDVIRNYRGFSMERTASCPSGPDASHAPETKAADFSRNR